MADETGTAPIHTPPERGIWVRSLTPHTPAHRIPNPQRDPVEPGGIFDLACPPWKAKGGHAITDNQARGLELFPCTRCFPAAAARAEQARQRARLRTAR